jgi:hypothetical protein
MNTRNPEQQVRVIRCEPFSVDSSASILATLTAAGIAETTIGHFGVAVTYEQGGNVYARRMVLKVKPHGDAIVGMLAGLAQACGSPLSDVYPAYQKRSGFQHTHRQELEVYGTLSSSLFPEIFGLYEDSEKEQFLILMECLEEVTLLNSVMQPGIWTDAHIREALEQIAQWHALHLGHPLPLDAATQADAPGKEYMQTLTPLWKALLQNAAAGSKELYTETRVAKMQALIEAISEYWLALDAMPKTLIHNDLNPRNTCFKTVAGKRSFCVYDWELSTEHVPQYDVVELLAFVLDADRYHLRPEYFEFYRRALAQHTNVYADNTLFYAALKGAAYDFGLHRLGMYMMAHRIGPYPFLPRVVDSYFNTLEQLEGV